MMADMLVELKKDGKTGKDRAKKSDKELPISRSEQRASKSEKSDKDKRTLRKTLERMLGRE